MFEDVQDYPSIRRPKARLTTLATLATLLLAGLSVGCATNPATGRSQLSLYSEAQEIQLGRESHQQILQQYGTVDDAALQSYVDGIGQDLAARSERPDLPWTFTVLDDPVVNAFALPGGFIYLTRGILSHMSSEAEMASVLGHEIGHVTARHGVNRLSKAQLAQIGLGVGMIASPELARTFGGLAQSGLQLLFLKYSRDDERQADDLGFRYVDRKGYNPEAFVEVFSMLGQASGGGGERLPSYLATHPAPTERMQTARARLAELPPESLEGPWNRDPYLDRLEDMAFGPDPRQGYFIGRRYVHPELAFQIELPAGWTGHNTRQALLAVNADQTAMVRLDLTGASSVDEAARQFYGQQGIEVVREWQDSGGGLPLSGERFFRAGTAPNEIYGSAAFSEYDGRVYRLLGVARSDAWSGVSSDFERSLDSFDRLRDREILNRQPMRLDLVTIDRDMTLEEFNRRYPSSISLERLTVLNHTLAEGTIPRGTRVKRVRGFDAGPQMNVELR
ncbi:MAG: M48 family metalloprotease [Acidobacteriota bacterium]